MTSKTAHAILYRPNENPATLEEKLEACEILNGHGYAGYGSAAVQELQGLTLAVICLALRKGTHMPVPSGQHND